MTLPWELSPKYFITLTPFLALCVGRAAVIGRPPARVAVGVAACVVLLGLLAYFAVERRGTDDWRGLATLLERDRQREEEIVIVPEFLGVPLERYYRGPLPVRALPAEPSLSGRFAAAGAGRSIWLVVSEDELGLVPSAAVEVPTRWPMHAFRVTAVRE